MIKPEELKKYLKLMEEAGLAEIELEEKGKKIKLRKHELHQGTQTLSYIPTEPVQAQSSNTNENTESLNLHVIKSPLVGTFYSAAKPGAKPFVKEGDSIKQGSILCIIEAMKVMNELKSDIAGTIKKTLVKNSEPVEFDQPLFEIEPL